MLKQVLIIFLVTPYVILAQESRYAWELVTDSAAWQARDSQGEVVYEDAMWILGGWYNSYEAPPTDVWRSTDGENWNLVTQEAPWVHSDLPMSLAFQNQMWMMGGWYNGRLEDRSASNTVWSSTDGSHWQLVTDSAPWSARCAAAIVEFKDRMWIIGGTEAYYYGDSTHLKNDVWSTADGLHWQLETESAPWPARAFHQAVVLNDRIYIFGGGTYDPAYKGFNDVWSSADGVHWRLETASAPWHERIWHSAVVYRDHIFLLGGWSNHPYTNWGDVWYSKDGRQWKELQTSGSMWKERHEQSLLVFKDHLYLLGGMTPPLVNDVWKLYLPQGWTGK